jgi:hypothetical protein
MRAVRCFEQAPVLREQAGILFVQFQPAVLFNDGQRDAAVQPFAGCSTISVE